MKSIDLVGPWQYVLDQSLQPFLRLTFPWIAVLIDWNVPPISLDKELEEILPKARQDSEGFDRLIQFRLISAKDAGLLIHFEFTNSPDQNLHARLNDRCQRIFDRFGLSVTHVTVLAGVD